MSLQPPFEGLLPPIGSTAPVGDNRLDPSTQASDYTAQASYWKMVDTIVAGVDEMRKAGELYLTRFQEERPDSRDSQGRIYDPYKLRLAKAPFTNVYDDILKNLSSKPFAKELKLKEGAPPQYDMIAENIDGQDDNLHVFGQRVFTDSLNHGISWILVDFSRPTPRADGLPLTLLDERSQNLRPYWVWVPSTRMLAAYSDFENGREIITHARIDEPSVTLDGYLEVVVRKVRVLNRMPIGFDVQGKPNRWGPPSFVVWQFIQPRSQGETGIWMVVDAGYLSLDYIPLVPVILGARAPSTYIVEPPLRNLAFMQIDEYNQESNVQAVADATCFPMFTCIGRNAPTEGNLVVGPRAVIYVPPTSTGSQGDFKAVEPSGASVRVILDKLKETRTEMRDLGLQPLTQTNLTVITTGQVAVKANSAVQAWAIRFKDAIEQAWKITADWLGDSSFEPEVEIHLDYSAALDQGTGFAANMQMRLNKDISRDTLLASAVRYGYLPDDFDPEADAEAIAQEELGLSPEQPIDPRTGQPLKGALSAQAEALRQGQIAAASGGNGAAANGGAVTQ